MKIPQKHPDLGGMHDPKPKRFDVSKKGYTGGQPDIIIINLHKRYSGFSIELKTPKGTGVLSNKILH